MKLELSAKAVLPSAAAIGALLLLDGLWLTLGGAGERFRRMAGDLCAVRAWRPWQLACLTAAAYVLLAAVLCVFAVPGRKPAAAAARGALLGLVIYGVFDLTNLAVFGRGYGLSLAAMDVGWGVFVMGAAACAGALAALGASRNAASA